MASNKTTNIIGISGSLKSTSVNTNILRTISKMAPQNVTISIFDGLDKLPHFNPEVTNNIDRVDDFRRRLRTADGVIISTPEYAFGIPGVLKNALDWLVFSGELNRKPVAAISASPLYSGGDKALASLLLTLAALGCEIKPGGCLGIPDVKNKIDDWGLVNDERTVGSLRLLLTGLVEGMPVS